MDNILIASKSAEDMASVQSALEASFSVTAIQSPEEFQDKPGDYSLLLLDENFTDFKGIDFLMSFSSSNNVPTMMLTSPDDPGSVEEAINAGAYTFLVKAKSYDKILPVAVRDSLKKYNEQISLKQTISSLQGKVKMLEIKAKQSPPPASASGAGAAPKNGKGGAPRPKEGTPDPGQGLMEDVIIFLKSDQVHLPTYPEVCNRVKEQMDGGASIRGITHVLVREPEISAKMVKVSNSEYYKGMIPIKTLEQAVSRIGISDSRNYVELIANHELYTCASNRFNDYLEQLWKHSMACAYISQEISRALLIKNPIELFAMGLFHDIGKLLLIKVISELETRGLYEKEIPDDQWRSMVTNHHGKFGASMLKRWKLPSEYWAVAKWSEHPEHADSLSQELLMVNLANLIAIDMGFTEEEQESLELAECRSARQLNLRAERISEIKEAVRGYMQAGSVV